MNKINIPLWLQESKTDPTKKYMAGNFDFLFLRFAIFKNEKKQSTNSPDYNLVISNNFLNKLTSILKKDQNNSIDPSSFTFMQDDDDIPFC